MTRKPKRKNSKRREKQFTSLFTLWGGIASVVREVSCFPRRRKFSALMGVSYIIQKLFQSTFRNRIRLSVCTAIFKRILGVCFHPKCLTLYIRQWICLGKFYKQMESFFRISILVSNYYFSFSDKKKKMKSRNFNGFNVFRIHFYGT